MKVSVVTISFNQGKYLQECIDSVARQEGSWEHIIVDPGSTDGSREIIEKNRDHFCRIIFEPDRGPADGLNKGFSYATGDFGCFINSDDFLLPGAFSALSKNLEKNKDADLILFGGWLVNELGEPIREVTPMRTSLRLLLEGSSIMFQQGMFFRMPMFRAVNGFNDDNGICWDFELLCDFVSRPIGLVTCGMRVAAFRVYGGTITEGGANMLGWDRLKQENKRLRLKYREAFLSGRLSPEPIARLKKYTINPRLGFQQLERMLMPSRLRRKWRQDIGECSG